MGELESAHSAEEEVVLVVGIEPQSEGVETTLDLCEFSEEGERDSVVADGEEANQIQSHHDGLTKE